MAFYFYTFFNMVLDNFWKKKATDTSKEQERIAKEQERKDFELISKTEKILFEKYKNIQKFDRAIKWIKRWIKLNSTWRPLYIKILNDLNNHNPRLISLNDVKDQILQSTKHFKATQIPSSLSPKHVELRRINLHVRTVISGLLMGNKATEIIQKDKKRRDEVIWQAVALLGKGKEAIISNIKHTEKKREKIREDLNSIINGKNIKWNSTFSRDEIADLKDCLTILSQNWVLRNQLLNKIIEEKLLYWDINIKNIYYGLCSVDVLKDSREEVTKQTGYSINGTIKTKKPHDVGHTPISWKENKERQENRQSKKGWNPDYLDERDVNLREYLFSWSAQDTNVGSEWYTLKQAFIIQNKVWLESSEDLTDEKLDNRYNEWKKNRLNNIKEVLNYDDLFDYAKRKQVEIANFDTTTAQNFREWMEQHPNHGNNKEEEIQSIKKFLSFTQWELIWELIKNYDMRTEEWLKLLQLLTIATAKNSRLFDMSIVSWDWNAETQYFLENALKDPAFQNSDTTWEYSNRILKILNSYPHLDTSYLDQDFQTLSEVQDREQNLIKNPDSIWQSQSLEWPREFVWLTDSWYQNSYKLEEQSFLNSHMQEFNGRLTEFLKIPQLKEWNPINETAKIKMEQIWRTIPLEQINAIYNLFASKPEEQEKFNNFLKENNLPNIDINDVSLKRSVLEQDYSFNPIAKYCYERIWFSCQNEIISESWKTLQYLSDKTWDTALNIKNKVLEFFLPWISIRPKKAENGIFYFRDENNLDTLYSFNPENWEISQQGNISLEDEGIISFRSWWSKGNLLQKIQWFQNIVDIDLLDILPDKNPGNMEELENQILNKIQSKIAVEKVADTSVVNKELLRLKNERNVCYNGIVWDLKQLLNIEDDYLYETSWENYKIFFNLLKTFERIDIEYPNDNKPLNSMKLLLDKICDSTESFTLLKPSLLENNREWDASEEISQENTDWEIQHSQKVSRGPHIIKNLIDPNTQLFDINLINDLAYNGEIDQYLAERKYDRIIAVIQKNKELKIAEQEYEKEVAQLHNSTRNELHWLNEDIELFANINSLENEGYFLS